MGEFENQQSQVLLSSNEHEVVSVYRGTVSIHIRSWNLVTRIVFRLFVVYDFLRKGVTYDFTCFHDKKNFVAIPTVFKYSFPIRHETPRTNVIIALCLSISGLWNVPRFCDHLSSFRPSVIRMNPPNALSTVTKYVSLRK